MQAAYVERPPPAAAAASDGLELQERLQAGCECWRPPALLLQPVDVLVPVVGCMNTQAGHTPAS